MLREPTRDREDVSQFVVHLTRNDSKDFTDGCTAEENLKSILKSKRVIATRSHCIFNNEISDLGKSFKKKFSVACFTETPLSQIHNLTRKIEGRKIELEPFGVVFKKELLIEKGAQQAIYINSYNSNQSLRESVRELFDLCKKNSSSKLVRLVPYLNAMHERYDFTWEREWRLTENFDFEHENIVCIILPEEGHEQLKRNSAKAGIAVISPDWGYEKIILKLAFQQRETKKFSIGGKAKKTKEEK
jgi:hypothetical protein